MSSATKTPTSSAAPVPPDDAARELAAVGPVEDRALRHVAIGGGVYTILLDASQTAGRYCLIEMNVPPGAGPPPHRHDFEEMFTILQGEVELTFRGQKVVARSGQTVNIPANAPHFFRNTSDVPAKLLCLCIPAGQEEFFLAVGDRVESAMSQPPKLTDAQKQERQAKAESLAAKYRTEFLKP